MIDSLFGSKTRVKMLYLFLNNPDKSFYVREITRKIDEQINSVRRELANMLSIGVIKSDSINNRLYYEANQNYPFYEPLKSIFANAISRADVSIKTSEEKEWQPRLKQLGDVKLALFAGKLVKGSLSTVDVLLVGSINKNQAKKFATELEEENGALNYVVMNYEEFYYRLSVRDKFVASILSNEYTIIQDQEEILTKKLT